MSGAVAGPKPIDRCDALLCSYPSSGRTWVRFMLADCLARLAGSAGEVDLNTCFRYVPNLNATESRGFGGFDAGVLGGLPVIGVTHADWRPRWRGKRLVWLYRDPMDCVSSRAVRRRRVLGELPLRELLDATGVLAQYVSWLGSFVGSDAWAGRCELTYEGLVADPAAGLARALDACGVSAPGDVLARAAERGDRDHLAALERERGIGNEPRRLPASRVREGGVAAYRRRLTPDEQVELAQELHRALPADAWRELERLGSAGVGLVSGEIEPGVDAG